MLGQAALPVASKKLATEVEIKTAVVHRCRTVLADTCSMTRRGDKQHSTDVSKLCPGSKQEQKTKYSIGFSRTHRPYFVAYLTHDIINASEALSWMFVVCVPPYG